MKRILTAIIGLIMLTTANAQVEQVGDVSVAMSQGVHEGFKVRIPEANAKEATRAWEKLMKGYDAKTSKVSKSDDYVSEGAIIPSIEDQPMTVYANFNETPEGVYLNVFFRRGESYLNAAAHPQKSIAARGLLKKFATSVALEAVKQKVAAEEKKFNRLEKEQKSLEKAKEGYESDIKKAKETIEDRESAIEKNVAEQSTKKSEIAEQKKKLEAVKREQGKYK